MKIKVLHLFSQQVICIMLVAAAYNSTTVTSGDCVLQPPQIRHRVLEACDDLQVIEIGLPAVHPTFADFEMPLPNDRINTARTWNGQKFVRFQNELVQWQPCVNKWGVDGEVVSTVPAVHWAFKNTGIEEATQGLASAIVLRPLLPDNHHNPHRNHLSCSHNFDFMLLFVLNGELTLRIIEGQAADATVSHRQPTAAAKTIFLQAGSSLCIPSGYLFDFSDWSMDTEMLEICVFAK
jgi:hypothetical protein